MKEFLTACPRNCYSTCSFRVQVSNNRIVRILPDPGNMATPEGPCIKGLSYIERASSSKRLLSPLIKNKKGEFDEISKKEALDMLAGRLDYFKGRYGEQSIFYYTGSGSSGLSNEIGRNFWDPFGGATTAYGNFCWPAGLEAVRLTLGENKHNAPWDIENASLIIIWGKNPAETNIQEMAFIDKARQKGCKIVVIDPRRTATADKADILLQINPGTDAALALAMASLIISRNLADRDFIRKRVKGFDEFSASLDMSPERAASICGVPVSMIHELAELTATVKPLTILPGFGMQRYTNGGQTVRTMLALAVITGNIGMKGAGFNYANLQSYVFDDMKEPLSYYPWLNTSPKFRRTISMARLAEDIMNTSDPSIHMAWIERGNPLSQAPDTGRLKKAFDEIEFKVVIDQFMTDTARQADLVMPAKNMFEQADIISSYWSPYVYYKPAVLSPPGNVMPEAEIYYELARRMDIDTAKNNIPEPGNDNMDRWLERKIKGLSPLELSDLKSGIRLAPGLQETAFADHKYNTPSGKIELYSDDAGKLWSAPALPGYKPVFQDENNEQHRLVFMSPNTRYRIHSQFGNLDIIRIFDPEPLLVLSDYDARSAGIEDGDMARVFNERGEIRLRVEVSARMKKGCISLPNGWWDSEGACGNFLSAGWETDRGHGTAFQDNLVSIERIS